LKWILFQKKNFFLAIEDLALIMSKIMEGVFLSY